MLKTIIFTAFSSQLVTIKKKFVNTDLIGFHGNNGAEGKNEGMNIFHVKVVCGHSVRH